MDRENVELYVQITDKCNFICDNCFGACAPYRNNEISNEVIFALNKIKNKMDCKIKNLYIYGGEPTLYLDKVRMLIEQRLSSNNIIITNGWWSKSESAVKNMIVCLNEIGVTEIIISQEDVANKYRFYRGIDYIKLKKYDSIRMLPSNKTCGSIFSPMRTKTDKEEINNNIEENKIFINLYGDASFCRLFNHGYIGNILDEFDNTFFECIDDKEKYKRKIKEYRSI